MAKNIKNPNPPIAIFGRLTAADIMEQDVQCGHPNTKADVLGSLMIEGFGSVPIVNAQHQIVGIVTEFDLLATLDSGKNFGYLRAQDIMTTEVVQITPNTDMKTLIYVLQTNHLIRVPVVDGEGKLIGIVARRDVVRGFLNSQET